VYLDRFQAMARIQTDAWTEFHWRQILCLAPTCIAPAHSRYTSIDEEIQQRLHGREQSRLVSLASKKKRKAVTTHAPASRRQLLLGLLWTNGLRRRRLPVLLLPGSEPFSRQTSTKATCSSPDGHRCISSSVLLLLPNSQSSSF
jgi:hypothetical protein